MALFDAMVAADPNNPNDAAAGLAGKVYAAADTARTTPLAITDLNGTPHPNQQIVAGAKGFVPAFLTPGDEVSVVWVSGPWVIPIKSIDGVNDRAVAAQATATEALTKVDGVIAGGVGEGGTGGPIASTSITDSTATGRALVTATDATAARQAIGAGTSDVTLGWGSGQAAAGDKALRKDGTVAQTVGPKVTFTQPPVVPVDSFTQDRIVGLLARLEALEARAQLVAADSPSTIPDTAGTGDWIAFRSDPDATDPGSGPEPVTAYRRAELTGLTDGVALPQALGTGDTALDVAPAGTNTVRVRNGRVTVEVGAAAQTTRWSTNLGLTVDEWSFDIELELDTASNASSTIYQATGAFLISLAPGRTLAVATSGGTPVGSVSPALDLSTLAAPRVYRLKGWKADADTVTHFRLYDPTGAIVWDVTRDVGVAVPSAFLWGRTGSITTGKHFWSKHRVHNVGTELA